LLQLRKKTFRPGLPLASTVRTAHSIPEIRE
ncbi:MAG: hypothetical protein ACI92S_004885, partial [Planctomycetaceae bacterium]